MLKVPAAGALLVGRAGLAARVGLGGLIVLAVLMLLAGRVLLLEAQAVLVPHPALAVQEQWAARQPREPRARAEEAQLTPEVTEPRLVELSKTPFAQAAKKILHAGGGEEVRGI